MYPWPNSIHTKEWEYYWNKFPDSLKQFWIYTQNLFQNAILLPANIGNIKQVAALQINHLFEPHKSLLGVDYIIKIMLPLDFELSDCAHELAHLVLHAKEKFVFPWDEDQPLTLSQEKSMRLALLIHDSVVHPMVDQIVREKGFAFENFNEFFTSSLIKMINGWENLHINDLHNQYLATILVLGQLIRISPENKEFVINHLKTKKKLKFIFEHLKRIPFLKPFKYHPDSVRNVIEETWSYFGIFPEQLGIKLLYPSPLIYRQ